MHLWKYSQCIASICVYTGLVIFGSTCEAGTWTTLTNNSNVIDGLQAQLLLTDGTVLCEGMQGSVSTGRMWKLTPDISGSYVNGTWSQAGSLPMINGVQYAPFAHAEAVLANGRVIYVGGEYNGTGAPVWTNMGAWYDPVLDVWTPLAPPPFFPSRIGDTQCIVLPNGTFMVASPLNKQAALLDPNTLVWTQANVEGKLNNNDEEGWTLLPNNNFLTVDCWDITTPGKPTPATAEVYNSVTGGWTQTGTTGATLSNTKGETGVAVLMANGIVFATGANGNTATYNYQTNTWTTGPSFPIINGLQMGQADGSGALLPNGNVFLIASPAGTSTTKIGAYAFEYDGTNLIQQSDIPDGAIALAANFNMLVLPTGEILVTRGSGEVYTYVSDNNTYQPQWQPQITYVAAQLTRGSTYRINGTLFNGMSQGAMFGDDFQGATNYPLVRITNIATQHVFYCRTQGHSSMAVAAVGVPVYTFFKVPNNIEIGASILEVVANGIPSPAVNVIVNAS